MTRLIFIRHAPTIPDPAKKSDLWRLSPESEALCRTLALQIKPHKLSRIYTSTEHKAHLTGRYVAKALGNLPVIQIDNLHETERHTKHFYDSQDDFRQAVMTAMESPSELLFGDETFTAARERLTAKTNSLARKHLNETIGIVTHGRILSMYLGEMIQESPVSIWQQLNMPAYAVLDWECKQIEKIVYHIEGI